MKITVATSTNPARLTKHYSLNAGELSKEPGGFMIEGNAHVVNCTDLDAFAECLAGLQTDQALIYGVPPVDKCKLTTRRRWHKLGKPGDTFTRTDEHFDYRPGPSIFMIDYDPAPGARVLDREELETLLEKAVPGMLSGGYVYCKSSSSHITDTATGTDMTGLRGQRIYIPVADGTDIPRAGEILVDRLWLEGQGYFMVSKSGAMLERCLVDSSVWQPSRLDFAAGASCGEGLRQNRGLPKVRNGEGPVNTRKIFTDLKRPERKRLDEIRAIERGKIRSESDRIHKQWMNERCKEIAGIEAEPEKIKSVKKQLTRAVETSVLFPDFELVVQLDQAEQKATVAEILADPDTFDGCRTLDPLEPDYQDRSFCAVIYADPEGVKVYSFAHGGKRFALAESESEAEKNDPTLPGAYGIELHVKSNTGGNAVFYWRQKTGLYLPSNAPDTRKALLVNGVPDIDGRSGQKLVDELMQRLRLEQALSYAGTIAGYDAGIHEFAGQRFLSLRSPKVPEAIEGEHSILTKLFDALFPDPECRIRAEAWTFGAWEMLAQRRNDPHPALALVGPAGGGKSLLIEILRFILGDYPTGSGFNFLCGVTNFNADLVGSCLLVLDDEATKTGDTARKTLGQKIKNIATVVSQRVEAKGIDAVQLTPHWRAVIATNDEPDKVLVLPPVDPNTKDKLLVVRAEKNPLPFDLAQTDARKKFMLALRASVPGWLHAMEANRGRFDGLGDTRFRYVTGWQEQSVLEILDAADDHMRLLGLIDLLGDSNDSPFDYRGQWESVASNAVHGALTEYSQTRSVANQLLKPYRACGQLLGILAKTRPDRVRRAHPIRERKWDIAKESHPFEQLHDADGFMDALEAVE